jgi:hypothetical protein
VNVFYRNSKAALKETPGKTGSNVNNVYDSMLELLAEFPDPIVAIEGAYDNITAVDSLCLGNTNAVKFSLATREGTWTGDIQGRITILDFPRTAFIDSFKLVLEGDDPLYLGYLYLGQKTVLPRFAVGPETGIALNSEASRSFGGQVFGMKREPLDSLSVQFPRITLAESEAIKQYVRNVQNIEPHIIDPYPEARGKFPPMYAVLDTDGVSLPKRAENGFYYSGSLAWKEAR